MIEDSALFSLLAGYLNIDWDEDYASSRDAVVAFLREEHRATELAEEIDAVLALDLDDEELARHVRREYDPGGQTGGRGLHVARVASSHSATHRRLAAKRWPSMKGGYETTAYGLRSASRELVK